MISALDEYGHQSLVKVNGIHLEAENVILIAVKVSVNSSVSLIVNNQRVLNLFRCLLKDLFSLLE